MSEDAGTRRGWFCTIEGNGNRDTSWLVGARLSRGLRRRHQERLHRHVCRTPALCHRVGRRYEARRYKCELSSLRAVILSWKGTRGAPRLPLGMQHEHGREIVLACKGVFLGSTKPRKKRVSPSKQRPVCVWPTGRDAGMLRAAIRRRLCGHAIGPRFAIMKLHHHSKVAPATKVQCMRGRDDAFCGPAFWRGCATAFLDDRIVVLEPIQGEQGRSYAQHP